MRRSQRTAAARLVEDALYPAGRKVTVPMSDSRFDSICLTVGFLGGFVAIVMAILVYNLRSTAQYTVVKLGELEAQRACLQRYAPERCTAMKDDVMAKMLLVQNGARILPGPDSGAP